MFGSFPKFHKRNISTEIILKLGYNFCRRSLSILNYYCANIAADPEVTGFAECLQ